MTIAWLLFLPASSCAFLHNSRSFSGIYAQGTVLKSRDTQRDAEKTSEPWLKCRFHGFTRFGWIPCSVNKAQERAFSQILLVTPGPPSQPAPHISGRCGDSSRGTFLDPVTPSSGWRGILGGGMWTAAPAQRCVSAGV